MQYFTGNNIGPDGAQSIADALKINQSITNMNLGYMTPNHPFSSQFITPTHNIPQLMILALMVLYQLQMHSRSINPSPT